MSLLRELLVGLWALKLVSEDREPRGAFCSWTPSPRSRELSSSLRSKLGRCGNQKLHVPGTREPQGIRTLGRANSRGTNGRWPIRTADFHVVSVAL